MFFTSNKTQMESHLLVEAMTLDVVVRHEILWTIKVQLELMVLPDSCSVFQPITRVLTTVVTDVVVVQHQARCQNEFVTAVLLASFVASAMGLMAGLFASLTLSSASKLIDNGTLKTYS
jgi:hypothetical protein